MSLSVSYSGGDQGYIVNFGRLCCCGSEWESKYWHYLCKPTCSYSSYENSDASYTITINSVQGSLYGVDRGYSSCGSHKYDGVCKYGCCSPTTIALATNISGSTSTVGTYDIHRYAGLSGSWSKNIGQSFTLAPGASRSILIATAGPCDNQSLYINFRNTNTKPTPTPPSVRASASCSTASYTSASFSASVSWGYCETGYNSSSYTVTDDNGAVIKSGSGTSTSIGSLQANSRYNVTFNVSNGCYSASSSASVVTATGNSITDVSAKTWDSGTVRVVPIMGGGVYNSPTHTVQITECNRNAWRTVATSTSTAPVVLDFEGLTEETCYQIRCVTTNGSACSYTSPVQTFNTPKKGICQANFTSLETDTNNRCSQTWADICYTYETLLTPATITVYYRVKDGYDEAWLVADERTINDDNGSVCFTLNDLFPNQVVYETYIHTHTAEVDWDSDKSEFTTPLCPEATSDNCASLTYMTEYLCAAVKKIIEGGNMKVFANPYSLQLCEPGNEAPTSLTLWSRYLRLAHAYLCILCDFMNLSHVSEGQYLVGEIGWVSMLKKIVEDEIEQDGWKLATSNAIWEVIREKIKSVWHYQGTVDVIVATEDDLADYEGATSAIVKADNSIYKKVDGEWVKQTAPTPENFGVWHINQDSDQAKAESGWYYWEGTWNNLDADLEDLEKQLKEIEEGLGNLVENPEGKHQIIKVVDKDFDFSQEPTDKNIIYFITENQVIPDATYYTVTFAEQDGTVLRTEKVLSGAIVALYTPARDGYTFAGWTKDGDPYDGTMPVTTDITVYANWTVDEVTVEFDIGEAIGDTPESITGNYGMTITLPTDDNFEYEGHTFAGWGYQGVVWTSIMPVWENITLEALWDTVLVTVAVRTTPDQPDQIMQVEWGTTINPPTSPTRDGYVFTGWLDEDGEPFDFTAPIKENTVIVAGWTVANATVTFNAQTLPAGASETVENPEPATVKRGEPVAEPVVTAEDYIIVYWTLNGTRYNFDTPVNEDITLVAVWKQAIEVEFDANGGEPTPETQKVPEGGYATKPTDPTKDGCDFEGWAEIPYHTVTVYPNNGQLPYTVKVEDGHTMDEPETPEKEGCTFQGWSDTKLINVTIDPNNGEDPYDVQVEEGGTLSDLPTPKKDGCKLDGWSTTPVEDITE